MTPDPKELHRTLASQCERVCRHLLPNGVDYRGEWMVGSVHGEEGSSMRIRLTGDKAGLWLDAASSEKGDMLELWRKVRGIGFKETLKEIYQYLGIPDPDDERKAASKTWLQLQREMGTGTEDDLNVLSSLRKLPTTDGLRSASANGHLFFGPVFDDGKTHHSWIVTDASRRSAQARRMDGLPWSDRHKAKTIQGTSGNWPIGVQDCALQQFAFTEGGPDFLAAYTAVAMLRLGSEIQPVALFGSSQSIHPDALKMFAGKLVWMFPHNDENYAGYHGALRWEVMLKGVKARVVPFDFGYYPGVKDLNDFVSAIGASVREVGVPAPAASAKETA